MYAARRTEMFTYVRGKKDGRKDLHMYAARKAEEGIYICTRQEGRKNFVQMNFEKENKDYVMETWLNITNRIELQTPFTNEK